VALFREERLTLGQAWRLADMDQFAFQSILADREIPVHYGIEEFREDLLTIDALARR
jgi:predicted HTH domain antitoxin